MTNFWDPAQMPRETEIGTAAVQAARDAGVKHLIWSTLPDSEKLTGGRVKVAHNRLVPVLNLNPARPRRSSVADAANERQFASTVPAAAQAAARAFWVA